MDKKEAIKLIYKILLLYEDVINKDSVVTEEDYESYLERIYVRFLGKTPEISETIYGLKTVGFKLTQPKIKSIVFHLISLIEKGGLVESGT